MGSRDILTSTFEFVSGHNWKAFWAKRRPLFVSSLQAFPGLGSAAAHPGWVPAPHLGPPMRHISCHVWVTGSKEAEPGLLGTGYKGTQGQTMCVRCGPVQHSGALALSCNGTQFWGAGCWKMEHLGSIAEHLNWSCWDFSPEPRSQDTHRACQGTCTWCLCAHCCIMHAPAELQPGDRGLGGVTTHNLLAPHFRSSEVSPWVGGVFSHLAVCSLPVENLLAKQGFLLLLADSSLLEQPFNIILDFLKQQTLDTLRTATTKSLSTTTFSEEPDVSFNQVMENSFLF